MKEDYTLIYDDGEQCILKKKDIKNFLDYGIYMQEQNGDLDDEELQYYKDENKYLLEQLENVDDEEMICLYTNAMSGWFMIDNSRINELLEQKQYEEDLEELKGVISSNLENYLNGVIEEWVDWVRDNGGSRVKTYADIIDYLYEDILDDYMISDNIENDEIRRQVKYAVANYEPTDFENRRDLEIYVIRI